MFIDSLDPGGAETMVLQLTDQLAKRGTPVKLLHFGNEWIEAHAKNFSVSIERLRFHRAYQSKWLLPFFCIYLAFKLRRDGVEILHSHLTGAVFAGALAGWLARIGVVGTLHDAYSLRENPNARLMLRICRMTNAQLVAVSNDIASIVSTQTNEPIHVSTILNGVAVKNYSIGQRYNSSLTSDSELRTVKLVTVARLVDVKRVDRLLRILSNLNCNSDWTLDVLGDGPLRGDLENQSKDLSLESRVKFLGFVDQVTDKLADYDIFLVTSDSEGLSISLLEAMSAGLCCAATDVGGNAELVQNNETGILVAVDNEHEFTRQLSKLIESESVRDRLGSAAHRKIVDKFGLQHMTDRYQQLYLTLRR